MFLERLAATFAQPPLPRLLTVATKLHLQMLQQFNSTLPPPPDIAPPRRWPSFFPSWNQTGIPDPTTLGLQAAIQEYLIHCATPPRPGSARSFLAALTFAASALPHSPPIPRSCWMAVSALTRLAPEPRRTWFPLSQLFPDSFVLTPTHTVFYGLLLLSFIYLLRISETAAIYATDLGNGRLAIHAAKRDRTTCWRPATNFVDLWLGFLRTHYSSSPTPSPAALTGAIRSLSPDTTTYTWHALRRGGAATLVQLGTSPEQLAHWGRWASPQSARCYFDLQQPFPVLPGRFLLFTPDGGWASLTPADLWPPTVLPGQPLAPAAGGYPGLPPMPPSTTSLVHGHADATGGVMPPRLSSPGGGRRPAAGDHARDPAPDLLAARLDVAPFSGTGAAESAQSPPRLGRGRKRQRV